MTKPKKRYLRYHDLVEGGLITNRATLKNWVRDLGFPPGKLAGPNSRLWDADEIEAWYASRPTEPKPTPRPPGRPPKSLTEIPRDT